MDAADRVYAKASRGPHIDFSAPGVDIWTARKGGAGAYESGTSYAAPYVMAAAASHLAKNKSLSREILFKSIKDAAKDLGKVGQDSTYGWGLVQAKESCGTL